MFSIFKLFKYLLGFNSGTIGRNIRVLRLQNVQFFNKHHRWDCNLHTMHGISNETYFPIHCIHWEIVMAINNFHHWHHSLLFAQFCWWLDDGKKRLCIISLWCKWFVWSLAQVCKWLWVFHSSSIFKLFKKNWLIT